MAHQPNGHFGKGCSCRGECGQPLKNHSVLRKTMRQLKAVSIFRLWLLLVAGVACSSSRTPHGSSAQGKHSLVLRVLVTGDVAGSVEPCGCVKDQLGGLDRFATAVVKAKKDKNAVLLEVGSLLFPKPSIEETERDELSMRAETLATVMRQLGLLAWVPGRADMAFGAAKLHELAAQSGATLLQSSSPERNRHGYVIRDVAGVRVGLFGLDSQSTTAPPNAQALEASLRQAAKILEAQGAQLKILGLNAPADAVARAVRHVSEFQLIVVGGSSDHGLGADSDGSEPRQVGSTLIVEPPNHLRGLLVLDYTVIDGHFEFLDATGVGRDAERTQLAQRIEDLSERIVQWKQQNQDPSSIAAREADLAKLRSRYDELSKPVTQPHASCFTIQSQSIGKNLAGEAAVTRLLDELGRRINSNNREKFADRRARPALAGKASYSGVAVCEPCHKKQTAFWLTRRHAHAYQTLVLKDRQFTLECVGCHVTGYGEPGGSSVTDVRALKNVQCETCHGPGSIHAITMTADSILKTPDRQLCATRCHHSPHVAPSWNVDEAWPKILGVGHGHSASP
jgi:hypothetical protein